jgi:transposase
MYMHRAERIILTPDEAMVIDHWARGKGFPLRLVQRAQIIQLAAQGVFSHTIAKRLGTSRPTVQLWRDRFLSLRLSGLEKDAPRTGRFPKISHKKVLAVVHATLYTTPPAATHWSTRSMAAAQSISKDSVQRIWKQYNLKPHLVRTFKLSRDKQFLEKLYDVVGLYMNPPDKAIVFCVDEKSQIQALERTQPLLPLRPGLPARQTHDYARHGTTTLFAALNMLDGTVIGDCPPPPSGIYQVSAIDPRPYATGIGLTSNYRQLRNTQTSTRKSMAQTASTFSFAFYSYFQFMAELGGTMVF